MTIEAQENVYQGSCLCQGVRYEICGALHEMIACHCTQCRKTSGHYVVATATKKSNLHFLKEESLQWYESTPGYQRGFCNRCGASLFWKTENRDYIAIFSGTLDSLPEIKIQMHIYTADKGKYYELTDGMPQYEGSSHRDTFSEVV